MIHIASTVLSRIHDMGDKDLVYFLTNKSVKYLLELYKHKDLNFRAKTYIRVLDEKKFIHCYDMDLYAYPRIFTTSKCIEYYMNEGLMNRKNMPYLPYIVLQLDLPIRMLEYYVDQYAYYPDGVGLFDTGIDYDHGNKNKWYVGLDNDIYLKLVMRNL